MGEGQHGEFTRRGGPPGAPAVFQLLHTRVIILEACIHPNGGRSRIEGALGERQIDLQVHQSGSGDVPAKNLRVFTLAAGDVPGGDSIAVFPLFQADHRPVERLAVLGALGRSREGLDGPAVH